LDENVDAVSHFEHAVCTVALCLVVVRWGCLSMDRSGSAPLLWQQSISTLMMTVQYHHAPRPPFLRVASSPFLFSFFQIAFVVAFWWRRCVSVQFGEANALQKWT